MKKNIQRIMSIMLILFLLIPSLVMADTNIDIDYSQKDNNVIVNIKGARDRPISITIKDESRYHYMNQGLTDNLGKIEFKATLDLDKIYDCQVNIDGKTATKKIVMEKSGVDPNPDPDPKKPKDAKVDLYIKGYKGTILNQQNIKIRNQETVLGLTTRILDDHGISYENRNDYIASIDGQKEFDKGRNSGWIFSINGEFQKVGAGSIVLKDGDSISWLYTYDLGGDIGAPIEGEEDEKDNLKNRVIDDTLNVITDEKATEKQIVDAIDNITKDIIDKIINIKPTEIKEVLDNSSEVTKVLVVALEKANTENVALKIADSSLDMSKSLNNIINDKTDKQTMEDISTIIQENMGIALATINRINDKNNINKIIDNILEISEKTEEQLSKSNLKSNKLIQKTIGIKILEKEKNNISIELSQILLKKASEKGICKIKIISSLADFHIPTDFIDKNIKEDVNMVIEKEGHNLNIGFKVENKILEKFQKPIMITILYDKTVKNKNKITTTLIREDGTKESIGGVYDNLTKTVKFLTNKPGKFVIEKGIKEFKDIAKHKWAQEAIESMAVKGVINGKNNNQFDPSANITRAEFSALVSRSLKYNEASNKKVPFTDVDSAKWYYSSIASVYENGLINGRSEEIFDPEGNITREEIAKIIGQILENNYYKKQDKKELNKFKDNASISPWAKKEAAIAAYNDIINGDNGNFKPKENATRAEMAVMLYRLYELIMD